MNACANCLQKGFIVVVVIVVAVTATVVRSVVNLLTIFENLGHTDKQTDRHTYDSVYRVAPQLKILVKTFLGKHFDFGVDPPPWESPLFLSV